MLGKYSTRPIALNSPLISFSRISLILGEAYLNCSLVHFVMVHAGIETHQICCWESWCRVPSRNSTAGASYSKFITPQVGYCSVLFDFVVRKKA